MQKLGDLTENVVVNVDPNECVTMCVNVVGDRVNVTVRLGCRTVALIVDPLALKPVRANKRSIPKMDRGFINRMLELR
ncbi:MAG: hypothetical protein ABSF09_07150 [Candidatus Bathyarchaeia archaeon]